MGDALQRAKMERMKHEKREKQRREQKEANKRMIAENKRKRVQQKALEKTNKYGFANQNNRKNVNAASQKKKIGSQMKKIRPIVKKTRIKPRNGIKNKNVPLRDVKSKCNEQQKIKKSVKCVVKEQVIDQYALSDYDSDFSESDLDEENCEKFIPQWAKKRIHRRV